MKIETIFPPKKQGMYVCYVEAAIKGFNYPQKELLMWVGDKWGYPSSAENYRGKIYGYIGPLPAPKIKELCKTKGTKKFAIGIFEDIKHGAFIYGPYDSIQETIEVDGEQGQCICVIYTDRDPKFIRSWDHLIDEWKKIK